MKTKNKILKKQAQWEQEKEFLQLEAMIRKEKEEICEPAKKTTTTKLLILFLFINFTIIELFTGWVTIQCIALALATATAVDLTPLVTLIGTVIGEVLSFAIYSIKSTKENSKGGIVYEMALNSGPTEDTTVG